MEHLAPILLGTPGWGIVLTILSYNVGLLIQKRCGGLSVANPVFISIILIGGFLRLTGISYQSYYLSAQFIPFLLGPATVAFAVPLVRNQKHLRGRTSPIILSLVAGSLVSAVSGIGLVALCGGSRTVAFSMAPKAVTTPIAMSVAQTCGGIPSLSAVFAIAGGILVAMSAKWLFGRSKITDVRAFGFAAGTAGSGIGAAHALAFRELAGTFAALAVGFNGLFTPLIVPAIASFWPR